MKKHITGNLYIRKVEIVDDNDTIIYKAKDIPVNKGMEKILQIIQYKDGKKTVLSILSKFIKNVDDELKSYFNLEE